VLANLLYRFDWAVPGGADPATLDMGEVFAIIMRARTSPKTVRSCSIATMLQLRTVFYGFHLRNDV
jgi:hypothetical protein